MAETTLFFLQRTYALETMDVIREEFVRGVLGFTPYCLRHVPGAVLSAGRLAMVDFRFYAGSRAPDFGGHHHQKIFDWPRALGGELADWMTDGFCIAADQAVMMLACAEAACMALEACGLLEHFAVQNPHQLKGPPCSECGCPGSQPLFSSILCVNRFCKHYVRPAKVGAIAIPF